MNNNLIIPPKSPQVAELEEKRRREHEKRQQALLTLNRLGVSQTLAQIQPRSFDDVFESYYPALHLLKDEVAINCLVQAIKATQNLLNVPQLLPDAQIRQAALFLLEDYAHLNLTDLMWCMRLGLTNRLCEFHGRFDAQVLYDWFYEYNIRRHEAYRYWSLRQE